MCAASWQRGNNVVYILLPYAHNMQCRPLVSWVIAQPRRVGEVDQQPATDTPDPAIPSIPARRCCPRVIPTLERIAPACNGL